MSTRRSPEVQYLFSQRPEPVSCQICYSNLDHLTEQERSVHYDVHFAEEQEQHQRTPPATSSLDTKDTDAWYTSMTGGGRRAKGSGKGEKSAPYHSPIVLAHDAYWHPFMETAPPKNFTPGLIPVMRRLMLHPKSPTRRAVLCSEGVTHISGQFVDKTWTCGYRNFMMAATALTTQPYQRSYFAMLESDPRCPPGIRNLQRWIESAWKEGYDTVGAQQLKHRLVGTTKWIGTGEIYVALTWKGIPCELVDFPKSKYSRNHDTAMALIHWVVEYFSSSTSPSQAPPPSGPPNSSPDGQHDPQITMSNHMPIILQHNGHSRSIVGFELTKSGATNLLIFDPAKSIKEPLRKAALACYGRSKKSRAATHTFTPPSKKSSESPSSSRPQNAPPPSYKPPPSPPTPPPSSRRAPSTKNGDDSKSVKSVKLITSFFSRSKPHLPLPRLKRSKGDPESPSKAKQQSNIDDDPIIIDSESDVEEVNGGLAKRTRGGGGNPDDIMEVDKDGFPVDLQERSQRPKEKRSPTVLRKAPQYSEEEELDPFRALNVFRVDLGQLSRHGEYQILYFPLTDPLTDQQKRDRMTVTSDRVVV